MRAIPSTRRVKVAAAAGEEPITLAQLKQHLKLSSTNEDDYLENIIIPSARDFVELYTGRKLVNTGLELFLDRTLDLSEVWWSGVIQASRASIYNVREIEMPWLPLYSVTEVSTFDDDGTETTYNSSNYYVDNVDQDINGRIVLNDSATIPTDLRPANAVRVQYIAGYGPSAEDVPPALKFACLTVAAFMYRNRGDCVDASKCVEASGAAGSLEVYRVLMV